MATTEKEHKCQSHQGSDGDPVTRVSKLTCHNVLNDTQAPKSLAITELGPRSLKGRTEHSCALSSLGALSTPQDQQQRDTIPEYNTG